MSNNIFEVLQKIYDSEINFSISTFWDSGVEVKLGDHTAGFKWEFTYDYIEEAIYNLAIQVIKYYPESEFVDWAANKYFAVNYKINEAR